MEASSVEGNKNDVFMLNVLDLMDNIVEKKDKKEKGINKGEKKKIVSRITISK